ncbi:MULTISPECIES: hypothetical protein [unclassified Bradyrhizobium]|nr:MULTISPECIES: hypothetical protein [unclassified Bradyrhizobium]MCK1710016.1 hypothetical protein [Bradyrhizobium sp. 143]
MADDKFQYDRNYLRLLELSPFERRPRGGWRFGTKIISDVIVDRLLASGRAEVSGVYLFLKRKPNERERDHREKFSSVSLLDAT